MLHHLAGATIQVANLVNYNYNLQEEGNKRVFVRTNDMCGSRGGDRGPDPPSKITKV